MKPLARVTQRQVCQLLVCFGPWPCYVTLGWWLSDFEPQFLYHWDNHGPTLWENGTCKMLGTGLAHTVGTL